MSRTRDDSPVRFKRIRYGNVCEFFEIALDWWLEGVNELHCKAQVKSRLLRWYGRWNCLHPRTPSESMELLLIAMFSIALKLESSEWYPRYHHLSTMLEHRVAAEDIKQCEMLVLHVLDWQLFQGGVQCT